MAKPIHGCLPFKQSKLTARSCSRATILSVVADCKSAQVAYWRAVESWMLGVGSYTAVEKCREGIVAAELIMQPLWAAIWNKEQQQLVQEEA
jgi:hypothetical protein